MLPDSWWVAIHKRRRPATRPPPQNWQKTLDLLCPHLRCRFPVTRDRDFIDDAATEALYVIYESAGSV